MITPLTPIVIPPTSGQVADGLWITSLIISAPSTTEPVRLVAHICPMISADGSLLKQQQQTLTVGDVFALASIDPATATAMEAIFAAVQGQVTGQGLF